MLNQKSGVGGLKAKVYFTLYARAPRIFVMGHTCTLNSRAVVIYPQGGNKKTVLNLSRTLVDPVPEDVRFWIFVFRYLFLKIS